MSDNKLHATHQCLVFQHYLTLIVALSRLESQLCVACVPTLRCANLQFWEYLSSFVFLTQGRRVSAALMPPYVMKHWTLCSPWLQLQSASISHNPQHIPSSASSPLSSESSPTRHHQHHHEHLCHHHHAGKQQHPQHYDHQHRHRHLSIHISHSTS